MTTGITMWLSRTITLWSNTTSSHLAFVCRTTLDTAFRTIWRQTTSATQATATKMSKASKWATTEAKAVPAPHDSKTPVICSSKFQSSMFSPHLRSPVRPSIPDSVVLSLPIPGTRHRKSARARCSPRPVHRFGRACISGSPSSGRARH